MIRIRFLKINHIITGHHTEQMHLDMVVLGEAPDRTDWAKEINVDTRYII